MGGSTEAFRWATSIPSCEAVFGTPLPLVNCTDWLAIETFNPAKIAKTFRRDDKLIKGTRGTQSRQLASRMGSIPFKTEASIEALLWLLELGLGADPVTGSGDPYTHTLKEPPVCVKYPPSTSLIQGIVCSGLTAGYRQFSGVTLDKFDLTMNGEGPLDLAWDFKTDGREPAQVGFSWPTTPLAVNYLLGSHVNLKLYPNGGSVIDVTSRLQSLKLSYNFGVQRIKEASGSIFVPRYRYSKGNPKLSLEFVLNGDKSDAVYGYHDNETLLTAVVTLDTGLVPARSIVPTISKCYIDVEAQNDDIEPTLNCKADLIDVVADNGPVIWVGKSAVASYLNPL
jgi:hypothetical protein